MSDLLQRVEAFIEGDVDEAAQAELRALVDQGPAGLAELNERFSGPLTFGTAGLRGLLGAGETRMNRAVVIRATAGLVDHLLRTVPKARERGIVIGRDARRQSDEFQQDAAAVCLARGLKVYWVDGPRPTPLIAFGVKYLKAAAGIVVTASHNPPDYNGYKVYWENGAQIIPPTDKGIAEAIAAAPPAKHVPRLSFDDGVAKGLLQNANYLEEAYLNALATLSYSKPESISKLSVGYTAMHGVGARFVEQAFKKRGFEHFHVVAEQNQPDGTFPTVNFPNPEESGALDMLEALGKAQGCEILLANDPDADRLGMAVKNSSGGYRVLSGNEIGCLLGYYVMGQLPEAKSGLVINTIVSSRRLAVMAKAMGFAYRDTLTGFKWIANTALDLEKEAGLDFAFGYEEALGYTVDKVVRDKDGISAALVMAEYAALLKDQGKSLLDALDELNQRFGYFVGLQKSFVLTGSEGAAQITAAMAQLRKVSVDSLASLGVETCWDLQAGQKTSVPSGEVVEDRQWLGNVLIWELKNGGRVCARPSGTEPKLKFYLEVVAPDQTTGETEIQALFEQLCLLGGLSQAS